MILEWMPSGIPLQRHMAMVHMMLLGEQFQSYQDTKGAKPLWSAYHGNKRTSWVGCCEDSLSHLWALYRWRPQHRKDDAWKEVQSKHFWALKNTLHHSFLKRFRQVVSWIRCAEHHTYSTTARWKSIKWETFSGFDPCKYDKAVDCMCVMTEWQQNSNNISASLGSL